MGLDRRGAADQRRRSIYEGSKRDPRRRHSRYWPNPQLSEKDHVGPPAENLADRNIAGQTFTTKTADQCGLCRLQYSRRIRGRIWLGLRRTISKSARHLRGSTRSIISRQEEAT